MARSDHDLLPGCSLSMATTLKYRRSGFPSGLGTSSGLLPVDKVAGVYSTPCPPERASPETQDSRPAGHLEPDGRFGPDHLERMEMPFGNKHSAPVATSH